MICITLCFLHWVNQFFTSKSIFWTWSGWSITKSLNTFQNCHILITVEFAISVSCSALWNRVHPIVYNQIETKLFWIWMCDTSFHFFRDHLMTCANLINMMIPPNHCGPCNTQHNRRFSTLATRRVSNMELFVGSPPMNYTSRFTGARRNPTNTNTYTRFTHAFRVLARFMKWGLVFECITDI